MEVKKMLLLFSRFVLRKNFVFSLILIFSCSENSKQVFSEIEKMKISIQPFSDISEKDVEFVALEIKKIYPEIEILKPVEFPKNTFYQPRNRHRADSIIHFLNKKAEKNSVILGLTTKDISATKGKNPDFAIMGLGFRPGNSCVASKFRLNKSNANEQFFKIDIHELGHTQGLPHCPEKTCFMRDAEILQMKKKISVKNVKNTSEIKTGIFKTLPLNNSTSLQI